MVDTCFCGSPVYGATTHPCCEFWRTTIETGRPCPACSASREAQSQQTRRAHASTQRSHTPETRTA